MAIAALALFDLALSAPSFGQNVTATFTNSFGDGIWERDLQFNPASAGNWSTLAYPHNGHHITDPNTGINIPGDNPFYDVVIALPTCTLGNSVGVVIQTLNVSNISTLNLAGGSAIGIANGLLTNNGAIVVNSTDPANNTSHLRPDNIVQLTGSGTVTLNGIGFNRAAIYLQFNRSLTQGVNHTIVGRGDIQGFNTGTFVNNGLVNANVAGSANRLHAILDIATDNQNNGTMKATNGALLLLQGKITQGVNGMFLADGVNSAAQFGTNAVARIIGGTVTTSNSGVVLAPLADWQDVTNTGAVQIPAGGSLAVTGNGLTNNGTILVNSTDPSNNTSYLRPDSAGALLGGNGTLTLDGIGFDRAAIYLQFNRSLTQGASHTIVGRGDIQGFNTGTFVNNGLVNANVAGSANRLHAILDIATNNQNNGTMKATNGAWLLLQGKITQGVNGTFLADGVNSVAQFGTNAVAKIIGGTVTTSNNGVVLAPLADWQDVTNTGTVRIPGNGSLSITGNGLTDNGTILVNSTDPVSQTSYVLPESANAQLGGNGTLTLDGVGFNTAAIYLQFGRSLVHGANHTIVGRGDIQGFNGGTFVNNGLVNANVAGSANRFHAILDPSTSNQNNGTMKATNGALLLVQGKVGQDSDGTFLADGAGSVVELGTSTAAAITGGILNTANGGNVRGAAAVLGAGVTNSGMYEVPANNYTVFTGSTFTNDGTMTVNTSNATFRFDAGTSIGGSGSINLSSAFMNINGQSVTNGSNHTIKGTGAIAMNGGSMTNNGTIAPGLSAGTLFYSGTLNMGSTSNLSFEIGGLTAGTQYDTLEKKDVAPQTLGGNLRLRLINGFVPSSSDMFHILTTRDVLQGAFANVANGGRLNTEDGGGSFKVTWSVVNDPILSRDVILSDFQTAQSSCPGVTPIFRISASPSRIRPGSDATITITDITSGPFKRPMTVFYWLSGTARLGTDYTLSGTPGSVTLQCGERSATITLHAVGGTAVSNNRRNVKAVINLRENSQYRLERKAKFKRTSVTIQQ